MQGISPVAVTWERAILSDIAFNFGPTPPPRVGYYFFNNNEPLTADALVYGGRKAYYDRNGKRINKVEHHDLILESDFYINIRY